jgi:hypothetical protein
VECFVVENKIQSNLFKRDDKLTAEEFRLELIPLIIVIWRSIGLQSKRKCVAWTRIPLKRIPLEEIRDTSVMEFRVGRIVQLLTHLENVLMSPRATFACSPLYPRKRLPLNIEIVQLSEIRSSGDKPGSVGAENGSRHLRSLSQPRPPEEVLNQGSKACTFLRAQQPLQLLAAGRNAVLFVDSSIYRGSQLSLQIHQTV